jgi:methylglutaconyl-CoA hydratase
LAIITLNRPEKRNCLNHAMWSGIADAARELRERPPRAVIVTGAGAAFCAGMDVSPMNPQVANLVQAAQDHDAEPMRELLREVRPAFDALVALPIPVIAAINGLAFGGGAELALRCDLRVMDPTAEICFSETRLGLMPDVGGGVALTRLLGPAIAADLILTARRVGAEEASKLALTNRVSATGGALEAAKALGREIAANGPRATRAALDVIRKTPDLSEADALALERENAAQLMASGECAHGLAALMSRAEPEFPDICEPDSADACASDAVASAPEATADDAHVSL